MCINNHIGRDIEFGPFPNQELGPTRRIAIAFVQPDAPDVPYTFAGPDHLNGSRTVNNSHALLDRRVELTRRYRRIFAIRRGNDLHASSVEPKRGSGRVTGKHAAAEYNDPAPFDILYP
jgi:hypothetical protein